MQIYGCEDWWGIPIRHAICRWSVYHCFWRTGPVMYAMKDDRGILGSEDKERKSKLYAL